MQLTGQQKFRAFCLVTLWLLLSYLVVASQPVTPRVVFFVVASGIIVFVPLYKRYVKNGNGKQK